METRTRRIVAAGVTGPAFTERTPAPAVDAGAMGAIERHCNARTIAAFQIREIGHRISDRIQRLERAGRFMQAADVMRRWEVAETANGDTLETLPAMLALALELGLYTAGAAR